MVFGKSPLQAAEDALEASRKELDASNRKVRALQGEVESYMIKLSTLHTAMQDMEAQLQVKDQQMASLKAILASRSEDSLERQLFQSQQHISQLEEQLEGSQRQLAELHEEIEQLELSTAYTAYASTQVSPSQTPTASMAEQMQQERQRRRAARKEAISLHKQQLRSQIEQLQQALQQANSQLHILGGTSVPDPLEMGPDGQGGSSGGGKAAFRIKQGRTGSMQEHVSSSSAGDLPGGGMLGADVGRHDTGNSQVSATTSTYSGGTASSNSLSLGDGRPTRTASSSVPSTTGLSISDRSMTHSSGQEVQLLVAEMQGLHKLLTTLLQVTSEAGSQANEAREALKGSARGLGSLHEVISGMADLMAHDQLSSAASQAVLGEQLVTGVQQLSECAKSQQAVANRVEAVAQMMHYIATRAPLEGSQQQHLLQESGPGKGVSVGGEGEVV